MGHQQTQEAPAPPPATWDAYSKKSEESNGVIAMMDSLVADLEKEMQEAELEEKDAQGDYEQFTRDAQRSASQTPRPSLRKMEQRLRLRLIWSRKPKRGKQK